MSGSIQIRPGISIGSDYTYTCTAATAATTGCTPLTGGVSSLTVTVVDPTEMYYSYVKTNDLRVSHTFRRGRIRFQPFMEIFNVLNLSTILTVNETIGPNFGTPAAIVSARRAQFGGTVDW